MMPPQEHPHIVAVRGASGVATDSPQHIYSATEQLLERILSLNQFTMRDVISIIFTVTSDLQSANPATVLRSIPQYHISAQIPLLCAQEPRYHQSMDRVIRILLHVRASSPESLTPVYINGAEKLRPDL